MTYDFFEFCTSSVSSLVAERVDAAVRVSTNSEETGGIVLGVQTLCPKGKYSKKDKSKTKVMNNVEIWLTLLMKSKQVLV